MNLPSIKILLPTILTILLATSIQKQWDPNETYFFNIIVLINHYFSPKFESIFNKPLKQQVQFIRFLTITTELTSKWEIATRFAFGKDVADASFGKDTKSRVVMIPPSTELHHEKIYCACPQQKNNNNESNPSKLPLVFNFHPGGMIMGTTEGWFYEARYLSVQTQTLVCSIDYRLSPQYPYPAGLNDAINGSLALLQHKPYQHLMEETCQAQVDYSKIATFGYSAGGYLSAHVARILSIEHDVNIAVQVSRNPMVAPPFAGGVSTKSLMEHWNAPFWNGPMTVYAWSVYLGHGDNGGEEDSTISSTALVNDYRVNLLAGPPAAKDVEKLPLAYVQISTKDVLRDEGEMYAKYLKNQGKLIALDEYNTNHIGVMVGLPRGGPGGSAFQRSMEIIEQYLSIYK